MPAGKVLSIAGTILGNKNESFPGVQTLGFPTKTIFGAPAGYIFKLVGMTSGLPANTFFNLVSSTKTIFGAVKLSLGTSYPLVFWIFGEICFSFISFCS